MASMSAVVERVPPPHAARSIGAIARKTTNKPRIAGAHRMTEVIDAPRERRRKRVTAPAYDCLGGMVSFIPTCSLSGSLPIVSLFAS
jgi:hypothetical protein